MQSNEMSDVDMNTVVVIRAHPSCEGLVPGPMIMILQFRTSPKVEECPIGVYGVSQIAWRAASQNTHPLALGFLSNHFMILHERSLAF
jgi:hypothetical protein